MARTRKTARLTTTEKPGKSKKCKKCKKRIVSKMTAPHPSTPSPTRHTRPARMMHFSDEEWAGMGDVIRFVRDNEERFLLVTGGRTLDAPIVID